VEGNDPKNLDWCPSTFAPDRCPPPLSNSFRRRHWLCCVAELQTERAGDDVHTMQHAIAFSDAGALVAVQSDGVNLVDECYCAVSMCHVAHLFQWTYRTFDMTVTMTMKSSKNGATSLFRMNFSGDVRHATTFSRMFTTTACCLVVWLRLGSDIEFG